MDGPPRRKLDPRDIPRTFMSPAYFEEREPGIFEMYRDILLETDLPDGAGGFFREKVGKRIGPMFVCRPIREGEEPDFTTSLPDGRRILLKKVDQKREELEEIRRRSAT